MLATLFVAIPTASAAATYTAATKVQKFDPATQTDTDLVTSATVQIKIDPAIANQDSITLVEILDSKGSVVDIAYAVYVSSANLSNVKIDGNDWSGSYNANGAKKVKISFTAGSQDTAQLNFYVQFKGKDLPAGDVKLNFFGTSGQLISGSVVVAQAVGGKVDVKVVGDPPSIGEDVSKQVRIRLTPAVKGSFAYGNKVKIKLPAGFKWTSEGDDATYAAASIEGERTLVLTGDTRGKSQDAICDFWANVSVSDSNVAKKGDVEATVDAEGTTVSQSSLIVAKYADYEAAVKVDSVKELLAGKASDQKTDKIRIEEKVPGTILPNRNLTIELPTWVKIDSYSDANTTFTTAYTNGGGLNSDRNKITLRFDSASTSSEYKMEFKLKLSIQANKTGDITAVVKGAGVPETSLVIAKAVAPVTVTATDATIKIGAKDQAVNDVVITEGKAGALVKDGKLNIELPSGVTFASTPSVSVTSGDLELKNSSIQLSSDSSTLEIPVKSESLKASTVKISGIKLNVDRTVPEGAVMAKICGNAVVDNYHSSPTGTQFNVDYVTKFAIATVGTPAPGVTKGSAVFTLGQASYVLNGQTVSMPVAPYVKNGRTYLPLRFCGNAIGISDANIWWDSATKTATLKKDNTVVQVKLGSQALYVNGVQVTTMDVAPEVKDGYTMLPIRPVLEALGAKVTFDAATQAVSIEYKE